ncbi:MAG: PilW family protein [Magnetococcales bacterium]|nr:PilW family protein [Magnetococcales bacterium]
MMKQTNTQWRLSPAAGFTLVELMVAMTLGLVLLTGIIRILQSNQDTYQLQEGVGEIQENGRFVLDFLAQDMRMTGFPRESTIVTAPIIGIDGGNAANDSVTIQYESATNCFGDATNGTLTQNQYLVQNNANGVPELQCIGSIAGAPGATATYTLVAGVESLQILYGEDTNGNGEINLYRIATNVADWNDVLSVRIAVLLRTADYVNAQQDDTYKLVNESPIGPYSDGLLRRSFVTTIALRNRMPF